MFQLSWQTLGILNCKNAVSALKKLTIKLRDRLKYIVVIAKVAVYRGAVAHGGNVDMSA